MKRVEGVWLPDYDEHFGGHLKGYGRYQHPHREAALSHCREFRAAVDVGAHVGTWTVELAEHFNEVHAFEPIWANLECLVANIESASGVRVYPVALGSESMSFYGMRLVRPDNSGTWSISSDATEVVFPVVKLDDLFLVGVDFLKVDVECYELDVLRGAINTLHTCRPVVCVELREENILRTAGFDVRHQVKEVIEFLESIGMRLVDKVVADHIFVWNDD